MAFGLLLPLRALQVILAFIVLGLSGYVANWYNADTLTASPSQINFLVFAPIFTLVALAYLELTPRFAKRASHPYAHLLIELTIAIFYLSGFIALAVFLSKLRFCRGSVCSAARGVVTFSVISFVTWIGTATLLCIELFKGGFRRTKANHQKLPQMKETT